MNSEWSLDVLYKGTSDPQLSADMDRLAAAADECSVLVKTLPASDAGETVLLDTLKKAVGLSEELQVLGERLSTYFFLRRSVNAGDAEGSGYLGKIMNTLASLAPCNAAFEKFAGSVPDLDALLDKDEILKEYHFYFSELKDSASHRISDEAEGVLSRMNISGGMAWAEQFSYLTSQVKVAYNGGTTTLSGIRALAADESQAVRKAAYEAEIASYEQIKDPIAFSLNSIKAQVNTIASLRGYKDPLEMTLAQSRMKKETLDALMKAIEEYLPRFEAYLLHKADLLGHKNGLPWYDILAPMGKASAGKYTTEDAHRYLIEHFSHFAPDIAAMMDRAFKESWIDFYPHAGKEGGAFCANLPYADQSRILTNFTGEFGDIVTLAHELGHAYHGLQIQTHRPLNWSYSMPVAETASNFNELVVMNDAISLSKGEEKIRLVESQLQDCTQIIVDILSRFLFEDAVISRRKDQFLYADDLCGIMLDAQKQAFGKGLDPQVMHPYMWCCKSHYYSADESYYNFPYAFGGLFSRGIYARYLEEGESFLPKYREMLKATTVASCEDVAKIAGIDLTDVSFWKTSLQVIDNNIQTFLAYGK